MRAIKIADKWIGTDYPCFIIAEAGINHNGDIFIAHQLIDAAVKTGADAIKFQSFVTDEVVTNEAPKAEYQVKTTGKAGSQYEMLKALELTACQQRELKDHCERAGIMYLCTPYDRISVDMLDAMDIAAFKIASTDATNIPFLRYVAKKGRPVLLSTGMSTLSEVELAINTLNENGLNGKIILLQCTSEYPSPINEANLKVVQTMQKAFACPVGFSDHTISIGVSPWAVILGACIIEKHFTLDRTMDGPDHRASLEPDEFKSLVQTVRNVESALGDGIKRLMPSEISNKKLMQKSLVAARTINAGEILCYEDLTCKRPANGLSPSCIDILVGKRVVKEIREGMKIEFSQINWDN